MDFNDYQKSNNTGIVSHCDGSGNKLKSVSFWYQRRYDNGAIHQEATTNEMINEKETCDRVQILSINNRRRKMSSTEEEHRSYDTKFYGLYANIRQHLDYDYHHNYTYERQMFQDFIIQKLIRGEDGNLNVYEHGNAKADANSCAEEAHVLNERKQTNANSTTSSNTTTIEHQTWIVFTAGAMGAGKTYSMQKLVKSGRFPGTKFVTVDPDVIRGYLPEFNRYVSGNANVAGQLTQKEVGFIAEILTQAAMEAGKNVLIDGSLRNVEWYHSYFKHLRTKFPCSRIAIIHITAPREIILERAAKRASSTGRIIPQNTLDAALDEVPKSIKLLAPLTDYFVELNNLPNSPDIELVTEDETWENFRSKWRQ